MRGVLLRRTFDAHALSPDRYVGLSRLMATAADLKQALKDRLQAAEVEVLDTSGGCGASFEVGVISDQFEGKKLLQRHRMINTALQAELQSIHALSIKRCWTTAQQREATQ